jgi:ABC-type lipoprotein export system ATPase subunit
MSTIPALLVTHDLQARAFADRALALLDGKISERIELEALAGEA